ncbi:MAG: DUF882 domain-containing protein [Deltaproteobacteria bacterium]|nr:DUF882 domain-containing protein [Deltaproteobacteria bacterium]
MTKRILQMIGFAAVFAVVVVWPSGPVHTSVEHTSVFRYSGDGVLPIYNTVTREKIEVRFRNADGTYNEGALNRIDHLLACRYNNEETPISLKLIEMVDYLQDHFNSPEVKVISGYRSPEYNAKLRRRLRRVARHSFHMAGRAMDLKLEGVESRAVRNFAVSLQAGGVGYYGRTRFLHIDSGPVRTW